MSGPRIPVASIQGHLARRAAMFVIFPILIIWHFNWRLPLLATLMIWNAASAAVRSAYESLCDDLHAPAVRLLVAAWRKMWTEAIED